MKVFFLAFCEANSFNVSSKLKFCRTSFSVDKIIKDKRLSCDNKDLFLFLILASFENDRSAVQLAIGIVR